MSSESEDAIRRMRALALSEGNRGRPSIVRPLEKAAQCRRLAAGIADDRASDALIKLAEEFEAKAAARVAREKRHRGRRWRSPAGEAATESEASEISLITGELAV